jgi:hypothetical protein
LAKTYSDEIEGLTMDWDTICESIEATVPATFDELILSVGDERLYVICLQTAEDPISIGASANTEED